MPPEVAHVMDQMQRLLNGAAWDADRLRNAVRDCVPLLGGEDASFTPRVVP